MLSALAPDVSLCLFVSDEQATGKLYKQPDLLLAALDVGICQLMSASGSTSNDTQFGKSNARTHALWPWLLCEGEKKERQAVYAYLIDHAVFCMFFFSRSPGTGSQGVSKARAVMCRRVPATSIIDFKPPLVQQGISKHDSFFERHARARPIALMRAAQRPFLQHPSNHQL